MTSSLSRILASTAISGGLPLPELLSQLGSGIATAEGPVAAMPPVQGVAFYDTGAESREFPSLLILVPSHAALSEREVRELCAAAAASGASGIAIRRAPGDRALERHCSEHGIALLRLDPALEWRQFDALVSRLIGEHGSGLQLGPSSGDKLFSLANTIAGVFRGSVAIEDHRRNILAYSAMPEQAIDELRANGILFRRVPDKPVNEIRYRQLFASAGIARYPANETEAPRAAIAIRAGNIPLGSIWAIDPEGHDPAAPLSAEKAEVLEQGAILAAGYLVDAWRLDHADGRAREQALRRILTGQAQDDDRAALGFRPKQRVTLLAVLPASADVEDAELGEARTAVARHLSVYYPGSICIVLDRAVHAIVPSDSPADLARALERLMPELARLSGRDWHAGSGEPQRFGSRLAGRHERSRAVASCARSLGLACATVDAVLPQLVLGEATAAVQASGLATADARALLADDDRESRETLLAWLEEQGSAPRVAERLGLHEQTVRYRMRRLLERLDLDLTDPDRVLALWLLLRAAR